MAHGLETVFLAPVLVNNIQRLREAKGWSRPELGKRCQPKTSGQQIERLEKGVRKLSVEWIERVAEALGVDPLDIITDAESRASGPVPITLEEPASVEAARTFGLVALGEEPEDGLVTDLATMLREFVATFAAHPATRRDPALVRPVADLLVRRYARQSH